MNTLTNENTLEITQLRERMNPILSPSACDTAVELAQQLHGREVTVMQELLLEAFRAGQRYADFHVSNDARVASPENRLDFNARVDKLNDVIKYSNGNAAMIMDSDVRTILNLKDSDFNAVIATIASLGLGCTAAVDVNIIENRYAQLSAMLRNAGIMHDMRHDVYPLCMRLSENDFLSLFRVIGAVTTHPINRQRQSAGGGFTQYGYQNPMQQMNNQMQDMNARMRDIGQQFSNFNTNQMQQQPRVNPQQQAYGFGSMPQFNTFANGTLHALNENLKMGLERDKAKLRNIGERTDENAMQYDFLVRQIASNEQLIAANESVMSNFNNASVPMNRQY